MSDKLVHKFENFEQALNTFEEVMAEPINSKLALAGFIKHFEFTLELSWKLLKAFLEEKDIGETIIGSKDTIRASFQNRLIDQAEVWLVMIRDRNNSSHMYGHDFASNLIDRIRDEYFPEFIKLRETLRPLIKGKD